MLRMVSGYQRPQRCGDTLVVQLARLVDVPVAPPAETALEEAGRQGILGVQSSRAGSGRVIERRRLREQGVVAADNLNPQNGRVLAMLTLTLTEYPFEIQRMFDDY